MPSPSSHQLDILRLYGALTSIRKDWGGGLVLCCGEGSVSSGVPSAVSIAGGATLAVESDAAAVKAAMRLGGLDFVVNTLDEALRTLKNEIRQRRPLSVGLIADVDLTLNEMAERGVQPNLLLIGPHQPIPSILQKESTRALEAAGMLVRQTLAPDPEITGKSPVILFGSEHRELYLPAINAAELRTVDERLLAILPLEDLTRRRWIQQVPKYLRDARMGGRWLWLTQEEEKQFGT